VVDPLSSKRTSKSVNVWAASDSKQAGRYRASFQVRIRIEK